MPDRTLVELRPLGTPGEQLVIRSHLGQQLTPEYAKAKLEFVKKREKIAPLYYHRAIEALEELSEKAAELQIPLAVESRSRFEDVPSEREIDRKRQKLD